MMAQEEVLKFLKKNKGKKFLLRDIRNNFNLSQSSLSVNLKKLCEQKLVSKKCKRYRDGNFYWVEC
jgi:predicted transcriptional regulator